MNTANLDDVIRNILTEISKIIKKASAADLSAANAKTLLDSFKKQLETLQDQLPKHISPDFSYEFYREASDVVEQITQSRLDPTLRKRLQKSDFLEPFNEFVQAIRAAVFRHKSLANQVSQATTTLPQDLEGARLTAKATAEKAAEASAEAEKANEVGVEFIEKIQKAQGSSKMPSKELIEQSFEHSLSIYVKNAAAVLAMDEAAIALMNLDDAIEKQK